MNWKKIDDYYYRWDCYTITVDKNPKNKKKYGCWFKHTSLALTDRFTTAKHICETHRQFTANEKNSTQKA